MKHRGLKFLSLLLTLALLVGLLPGMTAFAKVGAVYLPGETIETDGYRFYIARWSEGNDPRTGEGKYSGLGTKPYVESAGKASVILTNGGEVGTEASRITVKDAIEEKGSKRTPVAVQIWSESNKIVPDMDYNHQLGVVLKFVYGYTVTYAPGNRARLKDGIQFDEGSANKVVNGNIVHIITADNPSTHPVENFDSYFIAPEGEHFDHWDDGKGNTYKYGATINPVTENITLTAIWAPDSKPSSGSGSGGADIVFNVPGVDNSWEYVGGGVPQRAYRVSLAPMQGGSAALGLTTGESGTQMNVYPTSAVYVFPNADPGYTLDKIVWSLIDGSASYDITEAKNFVMPAMDVVVYVTFRPVG